MQPLSSSYLLKVVLVGLIAGLATALLHAVVTEPVIDQAIALEKQIHPAEGAGGEDPLVSRETQRVGLWLGLALYGVTWALLLGLVYRLAQSWISGAPLKRGAVLAALSYWAVGLLPFLKYPANPPGVGDPETIAYRQGLYLAFLALSVLGAALAVALTLERWGGSRGLVRSPEARWPLALAFLALYGGALYLVMPPNPDPIGIPAEVVGKFRAFSLAGLTLFWLVLGLGFSLLTRQTSVASSGTRVSTVEA